MRASPGEGRPYQRRSDGRWVVAVREQGKRKYLYGLTRSAVLERRDEAMGRVRAGLTAVPPKMTVGQQLADWLDDRRGKVRPGTWVTYEGMVRIHLRPVRSIPLAKLTPADVRRMIRNREAEGCAPATIRSALVVLRMAIGQAVDDGLIARNVASKVTAPRPSRIDIQVYQDAEPARLLAAAREDDLGALWALLLGSGLRLGEALALRWQDIDLAAGEVTVNYSLRPIDKRLRGAGERLQLTEPKTDTSRRSLILPAFVLSALYDHKARFAHRPAHRFGLAFTSPRGTALDPRNTARSWYAFLERAGLRKIHLHALRHTAVSLALASGATLEDVKQMVGHSTIRQTSDTYGHLVRARQREVAAMLDRAVAG